MRASLESIGVALPQGAQEVASGFRGVAERISEFEARISECEAKPSAAPPGFSLTAPMMQGLQEMYSKIGNVDMLM